MLHFQWHYFHSEEQQTSLMEKQRQLCLLIHYYTENITSFLLQLGMINTTSDDQNTIIQPHLQEIFHSLVFLEIR